MVEYTIKRQVIKVCEPIKFISCLVDNTELIEWCTEHFGEPEEHGRWWYATIDGNTSVFDVEVYHMAFYFTEKEDAAFVKLRWK